MVSETERDPRDRRDCLDGVTEAFAHSRNADGQRQDLREHLEAVAREAGRFAEAFGAEDLARAAGLWHDIGKFHPEWQAYLLEAEAGRKGVGPDHKGAGSVLAARECAPLAFVIAGHHGGLQDQSDLKEHLEGWKQGLVTEALERAPVDIREVTPRSGRLMRCDDPEKLDVFIRMMFSALVDADFLDTERHFEEARAPFRAADVDLAQLAATFDAHHAKLPAGEDTVTRIRNQVFADCVAAADLAPGFFRLTVPTGGGKTLSSLGFALRHALANDLRRVIVAVPYTTITEQTADVYRSIFPERAVLEHHSALEPGRTDDQTWEGLWGRLAAENWDAAIVVTTTVQLFQSLFSAGPGKSRKVHRLARSVIILDEAQALPPHVLQPILSMLRELVSDYGVTVVLCTATQPALEESPDFRGLPSIREIVPAAERLFSQLKRVEYEITPPELPWTWRRVADEMMAETQALTVMNTVGSALGVLDELDDADALFLSTRLCGAHRRKVLCEVHSRLKVGAVCRLVSTQVVEAGVDIDFPVVLRAIGPLDRVVQAAGRCNREGRLAVGRVVVFYPEDGIVPAGAYRTGTAQTEVCLREAGADLHDPHLYTRYFRTYYSKLNLDEQNIQPLRNSLRFAEVGRRFRMIADDTVSVMVKYDDVARALMDELRSVRKMNRDVIRRVQPYLVAVRSRTADEYRRKGRIETLEPSGLQLWHGTYDRVRGVTS